MPRLLDLVREPYGGPYEECAVSTRVNSVRNDDPDTIAPRSEIGLFLKDVGVHTKVSLNVRHRVASPARIAERTASPEIRLKL